MGLIEGDLSQGSWRAPGTHTPGHTPGHIPLYAEEERLLICGDAVHADVGWINIYREGAGAVRRAMASIERLSSLKPRWAVSSHGAAMDDPSAAFAAAHARYERWLDEPERAAWHAGKRIFAFALMLTGGLAASGEEYLLVSLVWRHQPARAATRATGLR